MGLFCSNYFESAAGLSAGDPIGNLFPNDNGFRIRMMTIGVRQTSGSPVDELLTVALTFAQARGNPTANVGLTRTDGAGAAGGGVVVDTAWSVNPTFSTSVGQQAHAFSLNTHFPIDVEFSREQAPVAYTNNTGQNGLVLWNVGNALPANHLYAVSIQAEV